MVYLIFFVSFFSNSGTTNPVELGDVHWLRSMDDALVESKKQCKPILILFQEVPGCNTCRQYGSEVLTHPLIVEGIESYFIPLAIYNNKGGHDAEILKQFNEPAWNNPVVRIVDEKGKDLISRLSGNYSAYGLVNVMTTVLIRTQGKSPLYLQLLADELAAKASGVSTVTYSMYCFWSGEAMFGSLNGVVSTTAGWQLRKEVVQVDYNPKIISKSQLDKVAEQSNCRISSGGEFEMDKTPKYYLSNNKLRTVPMTEIQKSRVNSAIAEGQNPEIYLSRRQLDFLEKSVNKNYVSVPLLEAWNTKQIN